MLRSLEQRRKSSSANTPQKAEGIGRKIREEEK
jgi:hypothetical protein